MTVLPLRFMALIRYLGVKLEFGALMSVIIATYKILNMFWLNQFQIQTVLDPFNHG